MTVRKGTVGLVAAIVVAVCSLVPPHAIAADKGVAVRFGGSASPFGESIKGYEDTRYYRHFGFAGHFFYRVPSELLGKHSFLGLRVGMHHLSNDARRGGQAIGLLGQFPVLVSGEIGRQFHNLIFTEAPDGYTLMLRAGAGINLTSFGNGRAIFDLEDAKLVTIGVDTKTAPVFSVGAGFEYALSKLTSIALDTDLIIGNVETEWKVSGSTVTEPFLYENADLHIRHFAVMLGVNILLSSGDAE